jgi:pyruvate/2-oxoglutarate dehydrogenase complex dihydrolipoamide dehydrogenase (E3) component
VRAANDRLTVRSQSETRELEYDKLLLGIGCKTNVEDLGLEAADIRVRHGGVEADASLRTSNPAVYAAGDVAFPENTRMRRWRRRACALLTRWTERVARRAIWLFPTAPTPTPEVATVGLIPVRAAGRVSPWTQHPLGTFEGGAGIH